jgi:hypothetical protein
MHEIFYQTEQPKKAASYKTGHLATLKNVAFKCECVTVFLFQSSMSKLLIFGTIDKFRLFTNIRIMALLSGL